MISGDRSATIELIGCDLAIDHGKVGKSRVLAEVVDNEARVLILLSVQSQGVLMRVKTVIGKEILLQLLPRKDRQVLARFDTQTTRQS